MKFGDLDNIWTSALGDLSNADKGRIYFERAKQVVAEALADPKKRAKAFSGKRFRRTYLVKHIACQPAVPWQNPKIRALLADIDAAITRQSTAGSECSSPASCSKKANSKKAEASEC